MRTCSIEGCSSRVKAYNRCTLHHRRWQAHGDPLVCKKPRSQNGSPEAWLLERAGDVSDKCLTWPFARFPNGRAKIRRGKSVLNASRVMCEIAHGPAPSDDYESAHSCGKGHLACVRSNHLRWATKDDNERDKLAHGTIVRGEMSNRSKLTNQSVLQIRSRATTSTMSSLAREFGVSVSTISNVVRRIGWRHI